MNKKKQIDILNDLKTLVRNLGKSNMFHKEYIIEIIRRYEDD